MTSPAREPNRNEMLDHNKDSRCSDFYRWGKVVLLKTYSYKKISHYTSITVLSWLRLMRVYKQKEIIWTKTIYIYYIQVLLFCSDYVDACLQTKRNNLNKDNSFDHLQMFNHILALITHI